MARKRPRISKNTGSTPGEAASVVESAAPRKKRRGQEQVTLRIIGGSMRGRRFQAPGEERTRPMKERVREAVFNLVGPSIKGKHAIDPFAGSGALGLEAMSRGAARATCIEQHFPTARLIRDNARELGVMDQMEVHAADAFFWMREMEADSQPPWAFFCSPPYEFYQSRLDELQQMWATVLRLAPPESLLVVESDERFDPTLLPEPDLWDTREYPPAVVSLRRLPAAD